MSVTNEEVNVPAGNTGGGGATPPPTSTSASTLSSSTHSSTITAATGASLHNPTVAVGPTSTTSAPMAVSATSLPPSSTPLAPATSSTGVNGTEDVVRCGNLRKLKGKKKYFVLWKETSLDKPARLEYYDKEKKFRTGQPPKKSIVLKTCFNISRTHSKCKYSIALHTHNDCVRIAMSSEEEMNDWLRVMNSLSGEEEDQVDNLPQNNTTLTGKPHFEHIWLVTALNKGLGSKDNIIGPYRLCLTSKEVTLLKVGEHDGRNGVVKFPLNVIKNISHDATFGCFFNIELGRLSPTGPGLLSLRTEDNNIAENMHLLILKAMQNYPKEDIIPRDSRRRLYTWNTDQTPSSRSGSFHNSAPPGMTRINSIDGSMSVPRGRTDSMSSSLSSRGFGISPPVPIMSQPPSFAFSSPLCSTGTDSASSSYSIDYDNNNHHPSHQRSNAYSSQTTFWKGHDEDESYVPCNPGDDQQPSLNSLSSLNLPLNQDSSDYVETSLASKDSSSTAQTPSSYMEMQSPMSPFDNYMPMSPGCGSSNTNLKNSVSGKISVSHSRNSSLIEEHDGYVPMNPSTYNNRCESGGCSTAGSTTGLDDQYLDMDFGRKLNLSNEDIRRMSPTSSESIQSGTPSSDFPLEKVSSYLTDDFDDTNSMRPARAYSVGSRSDTSSVGKNRSGKNRLEAVQETFRIRAMSVGSKAKRPFVNPNSGLFSSPGVLSGGKSPAPPLSSSWSGSTGRWPPSRFPPHGHVPTPPGGLQPLHNHTGSESNDSDLMELDFSHNKSKSRKRSLPGPNGNSNPSIPVASSSGSITKISPVPKGILSGSGRDTPTSKSDVVESPKPSATTSSTSNTMVNGITSSSVPKYATSAPISIQKAKAPETVYHDVPGSSILTKMTGMDLKKLKELDDDGAYLDMDFSNKSSEKSHQKPTISNHQETISNLKNSFLNKPVVVRPNESPTACKVGRFSLNSTTTPTLNEHVVSKNDTSSSSLVRSLSSSSNLSTISTHSNSSSNSSMSVKTQQEVDAVTSPKTTSNTTQTLHSSAPDHVANASASTTGGGLSRIEEFPEKSENRSHNMTPLQSPPRSPLHVSNATADADDEKKITYAHLPPVRRSYTSCTPSAGVAASSSCSTSAAVSSKASGVGVTYAQIDFVKNTETITPN